MQTHLRIAIYLNETAHMGFLSQFPRTSMKCIVTATKILQLSIELKLLERRLLSLAILK